MKQMVEGWRDEFKDPKMPVGVIGFCAGSIPQTQDNFENWSFSGGAFIREAQRLGLADVKDPENTAFLPAYDIQVPGLHPKKKHAHGIRAARWALKTVYKMEVDWDSAKLVSAERDGDCMVLTFDKKVMPDDMSMTPQGFSIADESGKFYMAYAAFERTKNPGIWDTPNKSCDATKIHVWSPLVKEPAFVRYAWATSPMGNLKVNGKQWLPLHSFRTDKWEWPESENPEESLMDRTKSRERSKDATDRCTHRKAEEAKMATEILKRLEILGRKDPGGVK
jgi:sialate O-acetylesterase